MVQISEEKEGSFNPSTVLSAQDRFLSEFERFEKNGATKGPSWVRQIRNEAIASFADLGFPTTRHEDWKYTNVAPILKTSFGPAEYRLNGLTVEALSRVTLGDLGDPRLVFVNGYYSPELSSLRSLPHGVKAGSLAASLNSEPMLSEPYLARYASYRDHGFVALNTAFMTDGVFVYVPKGRVIEEPIHLLYVSIAHSTPTVSYPRTLIVADNESQAVVAESYVGLGSGVYFTNAVTEILAGENASVSHYKLQRESVEAFHVATVQAVLTRSSNFSAHSIDLGGALVRNDVNAVLDGHGIDCILDGLYMVAGRQHLDNHTRIDHVKPHCSSRELYKGVLDGRSKGVFNGKIYVHKDAQKTDAKQTNKNLLLSEDAVINTKPQLEIHADDVKCTHGSTIGQLDQDAIFYLRSRGIDLAAARGLLTYAFASEMVNRIKIGPIRVALERLLAMRLQKGIQPAALRSSAAEDRP